MALSSVSWPLSQSRQPTGTTTLTKHGRAASTCRQTPRERITREHPHRQHAKNRIEQLPDRTPRERSRGESKRREHRSHRHRCGGRCAPCRHQHARPPIADPARDTERARPRICDGGQLTPASTADSFVAIATARHALKGLASVIGPSWIAAPWPLRGKAGRAISSNSWDGRPRGAHATRSGQGCARR